MQGFFNSPLNIASFYQQTNQMFQVGPSNLNNQGFLSLLMGHRQMIQKLLENQKVLNAQFERVPRIQTTDTEHSQHETEFQNINSLASRPQSLCKTVQTILLKQERQCAILERRAFKRGIQIVSSCPIQQKFSSEQFQQRGQIKQLQKHPEQNKKCCETKNIIKNYGKSILMFLRRNKALVKKILDLHGYDEAQFYAEFQKFKDRVNSITELKLFWTEQGNTFAKVYRIVANIYLKKYSLKHTFCSRVKNYAVHIKYRKRLLDVLKNPQEFSSIKYI